MPVFSRPRSGSVRHERHHLVGSVRHGAAPCRVEPASLPCVGRTRAERGSAVVEFALVAPLAIVVLLVVAQFALFLYERNLVMGSLAEGVRAAAATGRSISDGQLAAAKLLRESLGGRLARTVELRGAIEDGRTVLRADATLPAFVPGMPGLRVHMTAAMHKEGDLPVWVEARAPRRMGAAASWDGASASGGAAVPEAGDGAPAGRGAARGERSAAAPADGMPR